MKTILTLLAALLPLFSFAQQSTLSFNTLNDLVAYNPLAGAVNTNTLVTVYGQTAPGDWGSPRTCYWNKVSAESTNEFFVLAAKSSGQWIFTDRYSGDFDARIFGVRVFKPTYTTDMPPASSSAAIRKGLDYLHLTGGGTLRFPSGRFIVEDVPIPPRTGIDGAGPGMYNQVWQTNGFGLTGVTEFVSPVGGSLNMYEMRGRDAAGFSPPQTVFGTADGSYNTNYIHGGFIKNCAINTSSAGLRGISIYIDSCFSVLLENIGFTVGGAQQPILTWASNLVEMRNIRGLTRFPIVMMYTADSYVNGLDIGGTFGPGLWLNGAKNQVSSSRFFNSQFTPNTARPTFTADSTTDIITLSDANVGKNWYTGMPTMIEAPSTATVPGATSTNVTYYLVRVSDTQFKLNPRRTYDSGGNNGALQGAAMDITSNGTGTFTIGPGPTCNVFVKDYDLNQFTSVRMDQSYAEGLRLLNASRNAFLNCNMTESGWASSRSTDGAVLLLGSSHNNKFEGSEVANRSSTSHAGYGLVTDSGPTNNWWFGPLEGVTNAFGTSPNSWFVPRWDVSKKNLEVNYSGTWRTIQTLPPGILPAQYEPSGHLTMAAPYAGTHAAEFGATNSTETFKTTAYSSSAGQGPIRSNYRRGGTAASPSQVLANWVIGGENDTAYNGASDTFSIASILHYTEADVTSTSAPTRLYFYTTSPGSVSRVPRVAITGSGELFVTPEGISGFPASTASVGISLDSTTTAFRPSRLTTAQRNALTASAGMHIFNTTLALPEFYDGTNWVTYSASSGSGITLEQVQDDMSTFLVAGSGIGLSYNDAGNALTITATGGVSDGDKGDVTVSGSGTTWTIDNGVITLAKIANISSQRLLGRYSVGSGAPQEITLGGTNLALDAATGVLYVTNLPSGGGSLSDGDKGDVVVSGSGTVFTIDSQVVSTNKMLVPQQSLLGRFSTGSGSAQVVNVGPGLGFVSSNLVTTGTGSTNGYLIRNINRVVASNTVAETSMFTTAFAVPAGKMDTDGDELRFIIPFQILNNTGATNGFQWRLYINASTVISGNMASALSASSSYRDGTFDLRMKRMSVALVDVTLNLRVGRSSATDTAIDMIWGYQATTFDHTTVQDVDLTMELSDAQPSLVVRSGGYTVEKIGSVATSIPGTISYGGNTATNLVDTAYIKWDITANQASAKQQPPVTLTSGSTVTINADQSLVYYLPASTSAITMAVPTGGYDGQRLLLVIAQDATGGRVVSFPSWKFSSTITEYQGTTNASAKDALGLLRYGTNWHVMAVNYNMQ